MIRGGAASYKRTHAHALRRPHTHERERDREREKEREREHDRRVRSGASLTRNARTRQSHASHVRVRAQELHDHSNAHTQEDLEKGERANQGLKVEVARLEAALAATASSTATTSGRPKHGHTDTNTETQRQRDREKEPWAEAGPGAEAGWGATRAAQMTREGPGGPGSGPMTARAGIPPLQLDLVVSPAQPHGAAGQPLAAGRTGSSAGEAGEADWLNPGVYGNEDWPETGEEEEAHGNRKERINEGGAAAARPGIRSAPGPGPVARSMSTSPQPGQADSRMGQQAKRVVAQQHADSLLQRADTLLGHGAGAARPALTTRSTQNIPGRPVVSESKGRRAQGLLSSPLRSDWSVYVCEIERERKWV